MEEKKLPTFLQVSIPLQKDYSSNSSPPIKTEKAFPQIRQNRAATKHQLGFFPHTESNNLHP
ncbi:unnamed protein product, partial [Linum tenue]